MMRALLRRLGLHGLARSAALRWRAFRARTVWPIQLASLRLIARSGWASTLFYTIASPAFRREHRAVLAGRVHYHDALATPEGARYLVRRNVHRIEKGLIMRPRRDVFAAGYIGETADGFRQLTAGGQSEEDEVVWAADVLDTYFAGTGPDPAIDAERSRHLPRVTDGTTMPRAPYQRDLSAPPSVDIDALHALSRRRRSVRWFDDRPVPRDVIDRAVEVAAQAPSACNRQPYQFRIFDEPAAAQRVGAIPMGTKGFVQNFPALAVVVGDQSAYFDERDRHVIYIDASLASMSFLFALEAQGVASCCINWPDIEPLEREMAGALGLAPHERVVMLIAFGYPDPEGSVPFSQKRALRDVRSYG